MRARRSAGRRRGRSAEVQGSARGSGSVHEEGHHETQNTGSRDGRGGRRHRRRRRRYRRGLGRRVGSADHRRRPAAGRGGRAGPHRRRPGHRDRGRRRGEPLRGGGGARRRPAGRRPARPELRRGRDRYRRAPRRQRPREWLTRAAAPGHGRDGLATTLATRPPAVGGGGGGGADRAAVPRRRAPRLPPRPPGDAVRRPSRQGSRRRHLRAGRRPERLRLHRGQPLLSSAARDALGVPVADGRRKRDDHGHGDRSDEDDHGRPVRRGARHGPARGRGHRGHPGLVRPAPRRHGLVLRRGHQGVRGRRGQQHQGLVGGGRRRRAARHRDARATRGRRPLPAGVLQGRGRGHGRGARRHATAAPCRPARTTAWSRPRTTRRWTRRPREQVLRRGRRAASWPMTSRRAMRATSWCVSLLDLRRRVLVGPRGERCPA